jgi:hypothetical protein
MTRRDPVGRSREPPGQEENLPDGFAARDRLYDRGGYTAVTRSGTGLQRLSRLPGPRR